MVRNGLIWAFAGEFTTVCLPRKSSPVVKLVLIEPLLIGQSPTICHMVVGVQKAGKPKTEFFQLGIDSPRLHLHPIPSGRDSDGMVIFTMTSKLSGGSSERVFPMNRALEWV